MGTRGAFGHHWEDGERFAYQHFDSYPKMQGWSFMRELAHMPSGRAAALAKQPMAYPGQLEMDWGADEGREAAIAFFKRYALWLLSAEPEDSKAARARLREHFGKEPGDWEAELRAACESETALAALLGVLGSEDASDGAQSVLRSGVIHRDSSSFPLDSLFCEWCYAHEVGAESVSIHAGFATTPAGPGRWASLRAERASGSGMDGMSVYYGVKQIALWRFSLIRTIDRALGEEAGASAHAWLTLRRDEVFQACGEEPSMERGSQQEREAREQAGAIDKILKSFSEREHLQSVIRAPSSRVARSL